MNFWQRNRFDLRLPFGLLWAIPMALQAGPLREESKGIVQMVGSRMHFVQSEDVQTIQLEFQVADGYHIQSSIETELQGEPTFLILDDSEGLELGAPIYPLPEKMKIDGVEEIFKIIRGNFAVELPLHGNAIPQGGRRVIRGRLRYQPCSKMQCLFPKELSFSVAIEAEGK